MGTNFFGKRLWLWMFALSLIVFTISSFIGIMRGFDSIGSYMILSSMLLVIFCDNNLNREVLIETMMRISVLDILTNSKKRNIMEKMMEKDEKEKKTFEEYMKTAKRDIQKDGDEIENK